MHWIVEKNKGTSENTYYIPKALSEYSGTLNFYSTLNLYYRNLPKYMNNLNKFIQMRPNSIVKILC